MIDKHDEDATYIYPEDENGNRDFMRANLAVYKGGVFTEVAGEITVSVNANGGSIQTRIQRSELLEALGVTPDTVKAAEYAIGVIAGTTSLTDDQREWLSAELNTIRALIEAVQG